MATAIHPDFQIPALLKLHPGARAVLDRYGLKGCGGAHGPAETLRFFATAHGVDERVLLAELNATVGKPPAAPVQEKRSFADAAYKPFFLAGLAVLLLGGALTGTVMLAWMGGDSSFFAPGVRRINAHANAMVYGFAGMFILGFGYQALPRFRQAQLWRPSLAALSFVLLLAGVVLRFGGEFFGQQGVYEPGLSAPGFWAGVAGTSLELAAFSLFALVMWKTLRAGGALRLYERYVIAAALWFIASLMFSLVLFVRIDASGDFAGMVTTVSMLQEPLRITQMFGAIGLVVIGVMLRFLPTVFAFRDPGERLFRRMLVVINVGIVLAAGGFALSMAAKRGMVDGVSVEAMRGVYVLGVVLIAGGYIWLAASFAPWRPARVTDRSIKFIRAALVWLAVSLVMLLLEPLYIAMLGGFGHGYHAGMRHAFTIGFMTSMIVAVTSKVVPTLNGVAPARLKPLWSVFAILHIGLVWRVAGEIAGDFDPALLAGLHWSGVLIAAGLLIWAGHLVRVIVAPPQLETERATDITPETRVAAVVEAWPATLEVFLRRGFTLLANPVSRRTIARAVSLRHVCGMHNVDVTAFVRELRVAAGLETSCACGGHAHHEAAAEVAPAINPDATVAEIARSHPATVAVFAANGLDACCGGGATVRNAAMHHGKQLEDVIRQLEHAVAADKP
jgi:hypothetical protein